MVRGLDLFRERFRKFQNSIILIGGAACDEWFMDQGLPFRATKDLDIVLIVEAIDRECVGSLRAFIDDGGYEIRERTQGSTVLYRFSKPSIETFPFMLEFFSRKPDGLELMEEQRVIPLTAGLDQHSLSALLMDDDYYSLITNHKNVRDGLAFANATSLIPLKIRAWLDQTKRRANGDNIDSKEINKHRTDVFRLAGTLPGIPGPELPATIINDLVEFLDSFPEDSNEW